MPTDPAEFVEGANARSAVGGRAAREPQARAAIDAQDGIAALGPKPRTTKPAPGHKIFPYLLRGLTIERPNQVWAADITYIPIGRVDNVFIERLWRSLKYEDVYLKGYADGREAKAGIALWITFYNSRRPHQALGNRTPMAVWRDGVTGALGNHAVDMVDNASALPTCPQPQ